MNKLITLYISLCMLFVCVHLSYAENIQRDKDSDTNIVGHVLNKESGEHLPFVSISLKGTTIGTTTDATGHFLLKNLPEGSFTLVVKSIGYKTLEHEITLKRGKTIEKNFEIEEDAVSLDGVVISANRNETSRRLAPTLVNVLDAKMFDISNSASLADGLNFQPGVRVENNCQNCGFQQVRINGLDGPYTQILIDSRPIFSALTGVYGLEQIPANMIERVEIMRGGGSALFGSSAIAGTINVITKEPMRNSAQVAHSLTLIGGSSPDNNTNINASLVTDDHKAGIYIFGQNRQRKQYDHNGDSFSELGKINAKTIGFRSYIKTTDYSKLTFEYHGINEYRRGGNLFDNPPHEADIAEQTDHNINGGGLNYNLFSRDLKHRFNVYTSAQHTNRESYYGAGQDMKAYGETTDMTLISGAQYSYSADKCLFMPSEFTGGIEYSYDDLQDKMLGYNRILNQTTHIGSLFLQNEWKNDKWSFLIGGRLDKHNLIKNTIFSPRANIRYNPSENINLRLAYSSGFRAPQAFDEDLHIEAVGGEVMLIQLAKNLKEEKSNSISASVDFYHRFGDVQVNLLAEGFYTNLKDVFTLVKVGNDEQGNIIMERQNASGAQVAGVNLEGKMAYKWMQIQAGATIQRSEYKEAEQWSDEVEAQKRMYRTPDVYGYMTSVFTPVKNLEFALTGTYTGSMLVQHNKGFIAQDCNKETPDFWDFNLKVAYDIPVYKNTTLQVNGGIKNIFNSYQKDFDKYKDRDAGYIYGPGIPRSYFVGCKITY